MSYLENKIIPDQRFAKRNKIEYNVFSTEIEDASTVENWIGLEKPIKVLLDSETYSRLRNRRIEWDFDGEKTLVGVHIRSGETKD
jgi:hypothetical protein